MNIFLQASFEANNSGNFFGHFLSHKLCEKSFITISKLNKESRKTKKHIRHIIKLGLAFTFIIFFPISGCLQETILKSYEEKTGESINAYLCQAKDIIIELRR